MWKLALDWERDMEREALPAINQHRTFGWTLQDDHPYYP